MVLDDTLSRRICSLIDNILKKATKKQIKQKITFSFFGVRHIGLIVTVVTINGFTPVIVVEFPDFDLLLGTDAISNYRSLTCKACP